MDADRIAVEDHPAEGDLRFLEEQINAYNVRATGIPFGGIVSLVLRDEGGAIVAGLHGFTWGGCLEVRYLWVHEDWRGRGHGTRLLLAAEREAVARGCALAVLETHSFQAPAFYRRLGYEACGAYEGYPAGHAKYFLKKAIPASPTVQEGLSRGMCNSGSYDCVHAAHAPNCSES